MHVEISIDFSTINEVKYGCLQFTCGNIHEGHEGFSSDSRGIRDFYVFGFSVADLRMEVPRYQSSPTSRDHSFFCFSLFSSSEVLGKITSIRSKLPTAACWSREEKRVNCEANLL